MILLGTPATALLLIQAATRSDDSAERARREHQRALGEGDVTFLPAVAGEVVLVHNHVWHRSARTQTGRPRRALSVCYMDGQTTCRRKKRDPRSFVRVF